MQEHVGLGSIAIALRSWCLRCDFVAVRANLQICALVHAADATGATHADRTLAALWGAFLPVEQKLIEFRNQAGAFRSHADRTLCAR